MFGRLWKKRDGGDAKPRPMAQGDRCAIISSQMYLTLLQKADRTTKLEALLNDAASAFAGAHRGDPGADAETVLRKLLDSFQPVSAATVPITANKSGTASNASNNEDGTSSVAPALHLVVMTPNEHRFWLRFAGRKGGSDWLQPLRRGLTDLALITKRLELRFNQRILGTGIIQQHNLEQLAFEAEYHARGDAPPFAPALLAQLADELDVLAHRLALVEGSAEAGVVPFDGCALDLGKDAAASPLLPRGAATPSVSIADARTAHANKESPRMTMLDVVKGYTMTGLAADTLQGMVDMAASGGPPAVPSADLARATWKRCDHNIQQCLGGELGHPGTRISSLLSRWMNVTSTPDFVVQQVYMADMMLDDADKKRQKALPAPAPLTAPAAEPSPVPAPVPSPETAPAVPAPAPGPAPASGSRPSSMPPSGGRPNKASSSIPRRVTAPISTTAATTTAPGSISTTLARRSVASLRSASDTPASPTWMRGTAASTSRRESSPSSPVRPSPSRRSTTADRTTSAAPPASTGSSRAAALERP